MADEVETIKAWQCIGCGRVEASAPCVGVCRDEPVELVNADAYRAAMALAEQERSRGAALEEVVRRIALTFPKDGEWERTWRALQVQARQALACHPDAANAAGARRTSAAPAPGLPQPHL